MTRIQRLLLIHLFWKLSEMFLLSARRYSAFAFELLSSQHSRQRNPSRCFRTTTITKSLLRNQERDDSVVDLVETLDPSLNDQVDWNDRVGMQAKWNNKEKGWQVMVEWRQTPYGAGLFAAQDIPNGTLLRVGRNGINLAQFESIQDIEDFCGGAGEDKEIYTAKLNYVKDYMWGFSPNTDEHGYDLVTDDQALVKKYASERFFGMWCPGNGLNHNTNPNTVYRAATKENGGKGGTKVGINLVAISDIKAGDELFDDYRRHGSAPHWLLDFAKKYDVTLNFSECNDFVGE